MAASGSDPDVPDSGTYYLRQSRSSEHNYSDLALPTGSRIDSWAYGSASKNWENTQHRKAQLLNFLSSLQHPTEQSVISNKMTDGEMTNYSVKQAEQKKTIEIIDLSDDEDEKKSGCTNLVPETNKQLTTSELAGSSSKWMAFNGRDQTYASMLPERDKNTQIVPYDQNVALLNHLPLQTSWQPSVQFEKVVLQKRPEEALMQDLMAANIVEKKAELQAFYPSTDKWQQRSDPSMHVNEDAAVVPRRRKRKCDPNPTAADFLFDSQKGVISPETNMSLEEEKPIRESDGLEDYWKDFALAVESTKLDAADETENVKEVDNEKIEDNDCNHDIRIHEDLGHVCRVCGMIVRRAESIIDYQWKKARRRTNFYQGHSKEAEEIDYGPVTLSEDFIVADIAIHPRHAKQMRSHQLEGFNFLVKNLIADKPGGCILAHAPGSGKTFMLISFIQSFLARYPSARPLIVLPKGIVGHWKDEFRRWQVQDIPLYDFYSVKAERRVEQLEVLKSWESNMSILFLGYTQFSRIVSGEGGGSVAAACRERLLKVPNLLILDEGHKPRNRDTNVQETLNRVETPRKVVLSGTLFQNHVREVFTILDLVRPKFLKMESSRPVVRRIMSQVEISGRPSKGIVDSAFFEAVEKTLLNNENFNRKAHVIRGLRELTKDVLHYYKGDMLDELPGLVDFSVFLKLTPKQKDIVQKLGAYEKFKRNVVGNALYIHPCLSEISEVNAEDRVNSLTDKSVDSMIDSINVRDGVKARFFMNILSLAESAGEKVLAFSQYILPMKFLERLLVKMKGWHVGKEIFLISGDASADDRDLAKDQFNSSTDAKVLFGSIKACGEGISLVGASRIVILDVHLNPSVTRQAIGRAFRPGQQKKVFVYRLVAAESPEERDHEAAFKKEVIPKLWFEWIEHCTTGDFKLDHIDIDDCGDELLDSKAMRQDIKALYKRKQDC